MWVHSLWSYMKAEGISLYQKSKCGESSFSIIPSVLWTVGTAALAQRLLTALFRRFLFRRVPLWEIILQNLLFVWMVIYSVTLWGLLVTVVKATVEYCYRNESDVLFLEEYTENYKILQQWMIWMCGVVPLAVYIQTRPRPQTPPLMIWITTNPWQRREMGPYGYYLHRPLSLLQSSTTLSPRQQALTLRRAFSDSKIIIKEQLTKKRMSKSV